MTRRARRQGDWVNDLARGAVDRLKQTFSTHSPALWLEVRAWMRTLSPAPAAHRYFTTDWGYPLLELPRFVATARGVRPNRRFERDLAYASVCGYYCIRLVDDELDGETRGAGQRALFSALLANEFPRAFMPYFGANTRFFRELTRDWVGCFDVTLRDARLPDIDLATFCAISARKTGAARIPMRAAVLFYGDGARLQRWLTLVERLGRFVQMADDVLDWSTDLDRGEGSTYFLCEGRRRKRRRESLPEWVLREGLGWAEQLCDGWLNELAELAAALDAQAFSELIGRRRQKLAGNLQAMRRVLATSLELAPLLRSR